MAARQVARAQVTVEVSPEEAFALFTEDIGLWWRRDTPYWNDRDRGLSVRLEPGVGGRFIEVYDLETGSGMEVGRVTAWEPGRRVALTWTQVGWPEDASTELEISFEPAAGGTRVRLEHTGFELVPGALDFIAGYDSGWKEVLGWFAEHAYAQANGTIDESRGDRGGDPMTHLPEISDEQMQEMLGTSRTYTAMLLRLTEKAGEPAAERIVWEHGRRNFALRAQGKLPIVCPTTDESDWAGVAIFDVTPEEAERIMADDPGIKAGIFTYELHPVMGFPSSSLP